MSTKISFYKCDYCGKVFENKSLCKWHEKEKHKCHLCEHSYYAYGCEFNCERENNNKPCRFKNKK